MSTRWATQHRFLGFRIGQRTTVGRATRRLGDAILNQSIKTDRVTMTASRATAGWIVG